ncbi:hypothetical protein E1B28_009078 [Marasmius oreades]|uniref:Uncharacterized protein n=1 Tax=Marasmius oreades TaxID=181124 RepID=A0A9P7S0Y7_9AGAR|nr:uncharacterized protein E1B28_009078 [Marasmius oreades]KAG7092751.1 hypothetical protein E1B28_009078 [Marasmius oreades]
MRATSFLMSDGDLHPDAVPPTTCNRRITPDCLKTLCDVHLPSFATFSVCFLTLRMPLTIPNKLPVGNLSTLLVTLTSLSIGLICRQLVPARAGTNFTTVSLNGGDDQSIPGVQYTVGISAPIPKHLLQVKTTLLIIFERASLDTLPSSTSTSLEFHHADEAPPSRLEKVELE